MWFNYYNFKAIEKIADFMCFIYLNNCNEKLISFTSLDYNASDNNLGYFCNKRCPITATMYMFCHRLYGGVVRSYNIPFHMSDFTICHSKISESIKKCWEEDTERVIKIGGKDKLLNLIQNNISEDVYTCVTVRMFSSQQRL